MTFPTKKNFFIFFCIHPSILLLSFLFPLFLPKNRRKLCTHFLSTSVSLPVGSVVGKVVAVSTIATATALCLKIKQAVPFILAFLILVWCTFQKYNIYFTTPSKNTMVNGRWWANATPFYKVYIQDKR